MKSVLYKAFEVVVFISTIIVLLANIIFGFIWPIGFFYGSLPLSILSSFSIVSGTFIFIVRFKKLHKKGKKEEIDARKESRKSDIAIEENKEPKCKPYIPARINISMNMLPKYKSHKEWEEAYEKLHDEIKKLTEADETGTAMFLIERLKELKAEEPKQDKESRDLKEILKVIND